MRRCVDASMRRCVVAGLAWAAKSYASSSRFSSFSPAAAEAMRWSTGGSVASVTVTIGTVGNAGTSGANAGGTAGDTTVGTVVSCPGGIGSSGTAGQATSFNQSGAAAPSACTVTGPTTLKSIAGGCRRYHGKSEFGRRISGAVRRDAYGPQQRWRQWQGSQRRCHPCEHCRFCRQRGRHRQGDFLRI